MNRTTLLTDLAEHLGPLQPLPLVVGATFGSEEPRVMGGCLDRFCTEQFGAGAHRCLFAAAGVGVVCGLELSDGRQVVVKAHRPGTSRAHLAAVQTAQRHLATSGVAAPLPLAGPAPLADGLGTAETVLAGGAWADAHASSTRAAMAAALAQLVDVGRSLVGTVELRTGFMGTPGALWPTPHDLRFDFGADAEGARWIDDLAARACARQQAGAERDLVVGHTDWRAENMRFDGHGRVFAVYDWDSLRILPEPMLVGEQAANFTTDWSREVDRQYPTIEEALGFISGYEEARGAPFDEGQRRVARAGLVYALAYIARCEHSDESTGLTPDHSTDSAQSLLHAHGEHLLTT